MDTINNGFLPSRPWRGKRLKSVFVYDGGCPPYFFRVIVHPCRRVSARPQSCSPRRGEVLSLAEVVLHGLADIGRSLRSSSRREEPPRQISRFLLSLSPILRAFLVSRFKRK